MADEATKKTDNIIQPDKPEWDRKTADMDDPEWYAKQQKGLGIKIKTSSEILSTDYPEPIWIVEDILTEGVSLVVGRPKTGKSWLVLQIAGRVSMGMNLFDDTYATQKGRVLFLALEDTERRLRHRMDRLGTFDTPNLSFATTWPADAGIKGLDFWLSEQKGNNSLLIIDTLVQMFPDIDYLDYSATSTLMNQLKTVAAKHQISIVLCHHTRKSKAEDFMDRTSGSTGLTGGADSVIFLQRGRGEADAFLYCDGRDFDDPTEIGLKQDRGGWTYAGTAEECMLSKIQRDILSLLKDTEDSLRVPEIWQVVSEMDAEYKRASIYMTLKRMSDRGIIEKDGRGKYRSKGETLYQ